MIQTKRTNGDQTFDTGAMRESQDGKPRYDKIPQEIIEYWQKLYGGTVFVPDREAQPITDFADSDIRIDLIPYLVLNRLGALYGRGAKKYADNNWKRGMPISRFYASLLRHTYQWAQGDTSEDHLAAIMWNAAGIMWTEWAIANGIIPEEFADKGPLSIDNP